MRIPARGVVFAILLAVVPACAPLDPSLSRPQRRYAAAVDRVQALEDLLPFIDRTPDGEFLFEPTLLRMIELACGRRARRDADDLLDRCEGRLKQILHERPPKTAEILFQALKGLGLDLDLKFKMSPVAGPDGRLDVDNLSILPLARRLEGRCGSFSQFYLCLAERMGLPLSYVRMPRHAFIRIHLKGATVNFETTHPGWSRDRSDDHYREYFQGEIAGGHPFFLRSLTMREAALDAVTDELCGLWLAQGRHDQVQRACELVVSRFGPDAALERRFATAYLRAVDVAKNEVRDADLLREAMAMSRRIQQLNPNDSEQAVFYLSVNYSLLRDGEASRESAERILQNPRMDAEARWWALKVLKDPVR